MTSTIVMQTHSDGMGRDHATHGEHRADSCAALARILVSDGAADMKWESRTAAGTVSLRGTSLHKLAGLTVLEPDCRPMRWAAYVPHHSTTLAPALAEVLAHRRQAREAHTVAAPAARRPRPATAGSPAACRHADAARAELVAAAVDGARSAAREAMERLRATLGVPDDVRVRQQVEQIVRGGLA